MLRYLATPSYLVGTVAAALLGLVGHGLVQAWTARALGDPTPIRAGFGRPRRSWLDPLGVVAVLLTLLAWGFTNPVPMDDRPRRRVQTSVALLVGPAYLLALAVGLGLGFGAVTGGQLLTVFAGGGQGFAARVLYAGTLCAAGLFVVSMLPFPPLDLGRVLWQLAPPTGGWATARYRLEQENLGRLLVFAILFLPLLFGFFPDIVGEIVSPLGRALTT